MIFLVDLMVAPVTLVLEDVVKLLHVVLILWDHYTLTVQEQAREMLVHLIHELIASTIEDDTPVGARQSIEDFVELIRRNAPSVIWDYEDNTSGDDEPDASRVPQSMARVTREVVNFFNLAYDSIGELWSKVALNWATSCPVRHLACRSFQVFRCISTSLDSRMLADMLARLSNTIADEETDYQTFSMEILTTLKVIIISLTPSDLMRYPQLFWTTCACLSTIHEQEFMESIGMLEKFLDKVDMGDPILIKKLIESQPPKWEGGFGGVQNLVYKGLKSSELLDATLSLLHRLTGLPDNELVGDSNRLLLATLANLPHFLHQFDSDSALEPVMAERANRLANVAECHDFNRLAACLVGFANAQYKDERDFLQHIVSEIRLYYSPKQDVNSLVFLMGLLTNNATWFRIKLMSILCVSIPEIDMRRPEVTSHGPDLISPLLRLLQTDLCPQALEVMDHIMTVSGNPMERHHLRMSMASSSSSRAIRKEYERIQSLYGIPEPTGWSIPMPATQSSITRNNVHAVFYTCAETDHMEAQQSATPEVEFHAEEFSESYFPTIRADTMKSIDTQTDGNMGDIVSKLDSLDDFFEETETQTPSLTSMTDPPYRGYGASFADATANLYDQQTAPILHKSLARTASTSSFHNGLAESRPSTRLDGLMISSPPIGPGAMGGHPMRSAMHSRSITSPTNHLPSPNSNIVYGSIAPPNGFPEMTFFSDDDGDEENSDGDERISLKIAPRNTPTLGRKGSEGTPSLESMIRSGMRRLTGGSASAREKERQRDLLRAHQRTMAQTALSPRVPKVPAEYLTGSMSNPTSPGQT